LSVKEISSLKEKVNDKNDQADLTLLECTSSLSESGVNNLKKKRKKLIVIFYVTKKFFFQIFIKYFIIFKQK
jgi:hypothetical protein